MKQDDEHGLEFLLAFDGRVHHLERGHWIKFEIRRVEPSEKRPHGLVYSFTLHGPGGARLIGFDNAHRAGGALRAMGRQAAASDHWHRTETDPGRPYRFQGAEALLDDFFDEVERVLHERGIGMTVLSGEDTRRSR
jgi:hypothetical protein